MSWTKAIGNLLKIEISSKKLDTTYKASKKIAASDASKLEWDDIKFLTNSYMETALKNSQSALKSAQTAQKTKLEMPPNTASRDFANAVKNAKKYGPDHKATNMALEVYAYNLKRYCKKLDKLAVEVFHFDDDLPGLAKLAESHAKYGDRLNKAFLICAKIPDPKGTMRNAKFVALAHDAMRYKTTMGSVAGIYRKLVKTNNGYFKEIQDEMDNRWAWITWAESAAARKEGALMKNKSSSSPKK